MAVGVDHTADGAVRIECWRCWAWQDNKGRWHRLDGPAAIFDSGRREWRLHGEYHRVDGPAVIFDSGRREWLLHGEYHRVDGPAVIRADGYQAWWQAGQRHRLDGPAVIHATGEHEWYVHDRNITAEVEAWLRANNITWPFTPEQQAEFVLRWG